jgi:hypothetical protein
LLAGPTVEEAATDAGLSLADVTSISEELRRMRLIA